MLREVVQLVRASTLWWFAGVAVLTAILFAMGADQAGSDGVESSEGLATCLTCLSGVPALVAEFARRYGLTARELQVARHAASGAHNREIAEHLGINVRTVEGHLGRTYRKLDVHTRTRIALVVERLTASEVGDLST